jgi:hypothetical protein
MKEMDQLFSEEDTSIELEKLHVILIKSILKPKEKADIEAKKQYELYECLNPRYFENGITPKKALINLDSLSPRSHQSLIRIF